MRLFELTSQIHAKSHLERTSQVISRALGRLSTGSRLAEPRDDMASYALDVNLDAQVRGLRQGVQNINSTKGLASTAEEALSTQLDLIQEMRVLALQASSDTISSTERKSLNKEVQTLLQEFKRITNDSQWNGTKLLDGSFATTQVQMGPNSSDSIEFGMGSSAASEIFEREVGLGTFNSAQTYMVEAQATGTSFGDFNADGHEDVLYIDLNTDVIGLFLGNGDGTFQNRRTFKEDASVGYSSLAVGDVDNDGDIDAVTNGGVYLNDGDASFHLSGTNILGSFVSTSLSDINNDGNLDLWHVGGAAGSIYYQLGNGTGNFEDTTTVAATVGITYGGVQTADFNNDGLQDAVFEQSTGNTARIFLNTGTGFTESSITNGSLVASLRVGDLNNDGSADILYGVSSIPGRAEIWINNGAGTFTLKSTANTGNNGTHRIHDVNNDGLNDIVASGTGTAIQVLLNQGGAVFSAPLTTTLFATTANGDLRDFNEDGVLDFAGINNSVDQLGVHLGRTRWISAEQDINANTRENAEQLVSILDQALENIKSQLGEITALHSRLDMAAVSQLLMADNVDEARARVNELDYALELAELTRKQILQEAQTAVLAQANLQMRTVMALLADL